MTGSEVFAKLTQAMPTTNANPEEFGIVITKRLSSKESMILVSKVMSMNTVFVAPRVYYVVGLLNVTANYNCFLGV